VHASLVMPEGPEAEKYAKRLQEDLRKQEEAKESAKRAAASEKASGSSQGDGSSKKKQRVDYGRALLEAPDPHAPALKLPLPFTLKKVLVEDWYAFKPSPIHLLFPTTICLSSERSV